jgi:hypothetical protein
LQAKSQIHPTKIDWRKNQALVVDRTKKAVTESPISLKENRLRFHKSKVKGVRWEWR